MAGENVGDLEGLRPLCVGTTPVPIEPSGENFQTVIVRKNRMLEVQELYGSSALRFVEGELAHGDELTVSLHQRLVDITRIYTFVPVGQKLRSSNIADFKYSTTLSITDHGWRMECAERLATFITDFLSAVPSSIGLVELAESEQDVGSHRMELDPNHVFVQRVGVVGRSTYLFLSCLGITRSAVKGALVEERHYPCRTVLADIGAKAKIPQPGECLDTARAQHMANSARYLIIGAYDDETKLICEFVPPPL